jgi:hypothetical protein
MSEHRRIPTTPEVWAVVHASHPDLSVFGTISHPDGDPMGNPDQCRMLTEYGFSREDYPLIGTEVRWNRAEGRKESETRTYWLCVAKEQID